MHTLNFAPTRKIIVGSKEYMCDCMGREPENKVNVFPGFVL